MLQNTAAPAAYIWDQANATINKLMQAQDMLSYYTNQAGSLESYLAKYQDINYYRDSSCFQLGGCSDSDKTVMEKRMTCTPRRRSMPMTPCSKELHNNRKT